MVLVQAWMCRVSLAFQYVYGWNIERKENWDRENGSDIIRGKERMEIASLLVTMGFGVMWRIGRRMQSRTK